MDADPTQLRDAAAAQRVPAGYRPVAIGTAPPEIVQRDGYAGYGAPNAAIRLNAQSFAAAQGEPVPEV